MAGVDLGFVVLGYLLGSIPFGLILTRLAGLGDIREIGSGNIGATNVLRTGHKGIAVLTLLFDAAKGALAVLLAERYTPDLAPLAGAFAFLGHCFPVWLKFQGGKGVATFFGVILSFAWIPGVLGLLVWIAVAALFRFSSLASLTSAIFVPFLLIVFGTPNEVLWAFGMLIVIFLRHIDNIKRLFAGTESRIGQKSQK